MRTRLALFPVLAFLGCGGGGAPAGPGVTVKVMTRNLYLGADLLPVVSAMTLDQLPGKVSDLWNSMKASDLPGRAKLLAAEIAAEKPDLVGLQEAIVFYQQIPSDFDTMPGVNATTVYFDYVQTLLTELSALGVEYVAANVVPHTDVELKAVDPMDPTHPFDVRMTDRDAILARKDVMVSNPQMTVYPTHLEFNVPFGTKGPLVNLIRGLSSVDATVGGATFRFANTHLEVGGGANAQAKVVLDPVQEGEARDLINLLAPVKGPVVLVGDFNSAANGSTTMSYATVSKSFTDAWAKLYPTTPGFTCCTDITAPASMPGERIDIVFLRSGVTAQAAELVGIDPAKRTPAGLWPSDHAGVVATLTVPGGTGVHGGADASTADAADAAAVNGADASADGGD